MNKTRAWATILSSASILTLVSACSSNPYKVKEIDNPIEKKGEYQGATVGLNDKKEAIVQSETAADVELKQTRWRTYDLEQKIASEHSLLTRCRTELADPRLGGTGNMVEIPEIDNMKGPDAVKEDMGITKDGALVVVKQEMFVDKLKTERKYEDSLRAMMKTIEKHRGNCEREMGYARGKAGLPSMRYPAKGEYGSDGTFHVIRKAEENLDDAFRIKAQESKPAN